MKPIFFIFILFGCATFAQAQDKSAKTDCVVYNNIVAHNSEKRITTQTRETTIDISKSRVASFAQGVEPSMYRFMRPLNTPTKKGFYGKIGAGLGLTERNLVFNGLKVSRVTAELSGLTCVFGRQFNEKWGVGLGTGFIPSNVAPILPVFAEGRYFFSNKPTTAFASLAVGAATPLRNSKYYFTDVAPFNYTERPIAGSYIYPTVGWQAASRGASHFWLDLGYLHYDYSIEAEHDEAITTSSFNNNMFVLRFGVDIQ
jgi:hypothetical protein